MKGQGRKPDRKEQEDESLQLENEGIEVSWEKKRERTSEQEKREQGRVGRR